MKYAEIRQAFIDFFKSKQHEPVDSASLIPHNDPTLMFTNAGMNQFKDVFLGTDKREYNRAVTIQKCLRAGGKHNDLENVGFTARHHTFFEMMGNFSFGDYFKKEAIEFAWEFLTKTLGIPEERLYVTVFSTDDEAAEIWEKQIGVPKEKIYRFGEKDNFWRMGQTGPCGPCSEIFYDHNPNGPKVAIDQDEDRFVEIWNLVFMQFFEDETGKQTPLPKPSVDTGSGIERVAAVMQGVTDNYQTDVFQPLISKACELAGVSSDWLKLAQQPEKLGAVKVVADHARTAAFLMSEGVLPSNEGKGYVLRRIMRRAIRYARQLSEQVSIYPAVCAEVIETMKAHYPELAEKKDFILQAVQDEEKRFLQTLDKGSEILHQEILNLKKKQSSLLDGEMAFTLYDTYGFPFDLTQLILKEQDMEVDEEGFNKAMEKAKDKARKAHKNHNISTHEKYLGEWTQSLPATEFVGYEQLTCESQCVGISTGDATVDSLKGEGCLVFQATPFYAEGGGQVADTGSIYDSETQTKMGTVTDVKKMNDTFIHFVSLENEVGLHKSYLLQVETQERQSTASNHSATHLLNAALKQVLGSHVNQAGSLVNSQKLRFDFSHTQPVTPEEMVKIESLVNQQIQLADPVHSQLMGQQEAIEAGAVAMFGEKYGSEVRVLSMGKTNDGSPFSMELCGGTHVNNTAEIQQFKVVSESGVAAGVRRMEALTGERAKQYIQELAQENKTLHTALSQRGDFPKASLSSMIHSLQSQIKSFESQLKGGNKVDSPVQESIQSAVSDEDLAEENLRLCEELAVKKPKVDDEHFSGALSQRVQEMLSKLDELTQRLATRESQSVSIDQLLQEGKATTLGGEEGLALALKLEISDRNYLSQVADQIRDKQKNVAMLLVGDSDKGQPKPMIVAVSKSLKSLHAGKITKELCAILDGKGGGRPDFAQGSVASLDQWNSAKEKFYELLEQ